MAVASTWQLGCGPGQDNLLNSKLNVRMGTKGDLSNFERGMVVGISQSAQLLGFSHTTISRVYTKNAVKREKHPVWVSPVGQNALLMLEVRGEWAD